MELFSIVDASLQAGASGASTCEHSAGSLFSSSLDSPLIIFPISSLDLRIKSSARDLPSSVRKILYERLSSLECSLWRCPSFSCLFIMRLRLVDLGNYYNKNSLLCQPFLTITVFLMFMSVGTIFA